MSLPQALWPWIPAAERYPADLERVLIFHPGMGVAIGYATLLGEWSLDDDQGTVIPVTHWAPLPAPPP